MGHPRETNLPHDMGLPRPELAGTETRRRIYRGRWDIQGWTNWQVGRWEEEFTTAAGNWQVGRWEEEFTAGDGTSKGDEFTTLTWDFQGRNWQVGRWEEEFST